MDFNLFMNDVVRQARQEITAAGYTELKTPEEVDEALTKKALRLSWSTPSAAVQGIARPAAHHAVHYDKRPDHLVTVFAGQDKEATARAREYFEGYPPSSPSFALLKDGKILKWWSAMKLKAMSRWLSSPSFKDCLKNTVKKYNGKTACQNRWQAFCV